MQEMIINDLRNEIEFLMRSFLRQDDNFAEQSKLTQTKKQKRGHCAERSNRI